MCSVPNVPSDVVVLPITVLAFAVAICLRLVDDLLHLGMHGAHGMHGSEAVRYAEADYRVQGEPQGEDTQRKAHWFGLMPQQTRAGGNGKHMVSRTPIVS
jgi:hypothetical protein